MNKYEAMYIVNPNVADDARAALVERFSGIVTNGGGNVEKIDDWGKRKLAYEINDRTEGYYVLMSFTSGPEFPKELDRILGITEGIMRSMIVCKGE